MPPRISAFALPRSRIFMYESIRFGRLPTCIAPPYIIDTANAFFQYSESPSMSRLPLPRGILRTLDTTSPKTSDSGSPTAPEKLRPCAILRNASLGWNLLRPINLPNLPKAMSAIFWMNLPASSDAISDAPSVSVAYRSSQALVGVYMSSPFCTEN